MSPSRQDNTSVLTFWRICQTFDYFFVKTVVREYTDDNPIFWDNFLKLIYDRGILCGILGDQLSEEVEYTLSETQLFRSNKGVTYVTAALCRKLTEELLMEYINPLLVEINAIQEPLEVDPTKVDETKCRENVSYVTKFVVKFFEEVTHLSQKFPPELTYTFTRVRQAVKAKYGDVEALKIVGAFVFLRLLNPVLLTPQKFSTKLTKPSPIALRTLVLITKITQACVNQPAKPFQEKLMEPFTEFVVKMYPNVTELLTSVSENSTNPQVVVQTPIRPSLLSGTTKDILLQINKFATTNQEKFKSFCDFLRRRGHTDMLEQLVMLVDIDGTLASTIGVSRPKFPNVIVDIQDENNIRQLVEKFDGVVEGYQLKVLKVREEIFELQSQVRTKKNVVQAKTQELIMQQARDNPPSKDKEQEPTEVCPPTRKIIKFMK
ncbi:hypothetical protein EIN_406380 [Entamoeba invadens IP1]|uniref:Ras-GAP domain-containing protein n=1 Tax=Entamoeba invadens IP1 TaxID=370355 RepID=A0A0A1UD01_ENTIV|nr:hypothetical protein EIN_406380 [Entamoeba invadens IP1]ELP90174.1 hypothetical protein EIN_406380 [Entamoeba invadens IP1]|eukprot:XP_004256945.1 hypothetical protein EIN_406380 [Entamoeba invadens IP1]